MGITIAVAGKGGTGKTTLSSLLIRALVEKQVRPILAVDADPNSNLAEALGVEAGPSLAEIREQGSTPEGSPASGIGRVRAVDDQLQRALTEAEGFDLVAMGRPEGPRCYCSVNTLLRKSLDDLSRNYAAVVVDNEAGMEHLSRRTTNDVDFLVAVMNPTMPSFRAVQRILELSRDLPVRIGSRAVVVTRANPSAPQPWIDRALAELGVERLTDIPQDDSVERTGAAGEHVFRLPPDTPALVAVRNLVDKLCALSLLAV